MELEFQKAPQIHRCARQTQSTSEVGWRHLKRWKVLGWAEAPVYTKQRMVKSAAMWTGTRFRLTDKIPAINLGGGTQLTEFIPQNETVEVIAGPKRGDKGLVGVRWKDRTFFVFVTDLESRGIRE